MSFSEPKYSDVFEPIRPQQNKTQANTKWLCLSRAMSWFPAVSWFSPVSWFPAETMAAWLRLASILPHNINVGTIF